MEFTDIVLELLSQYISSSTLKSLIAFTPSNLETTPYSGLLLPTSAIYFVTAFVSVSVLFSVIVFVMVTVLVFEEDLRFTTKTMIKAETENKTETEI